MTSHTSFLQAVCAKESDPVALVKHLKHEVVASVLCRGFEWMTPERCIPLALIHASEFPLGHQRVFSPALVCCHCTRGCSSLYLPTYTPQIFLVTTSAILFKDSQVLRRPLPQTPHPLPICPPVCPSVCLLRLSVCLSVSVCLSICLSIHPSIHPSIDWYRSYTHCLVCRSWRRRPSLL